MKKLIFVATIVALVAVSVTACKCKKAAVADNSETCLDWAGTYVGTVPQADGEGIDVFLTLNDDLTYAITNRYHTAEGIADYNESGNFTWSEDGSTITLEGIENGPTHYKVGENVLIQLDLEGNEITGDLAANYILTKQCSDEGAECCKDKE